MAVEKSWCPSVIRATILAAVLLSAAMDSAAAMNPILLGQNFRIPLPLMREEALFSQSYPMPTKPLLERTEGNFIIRKPFFRWQTTYPYLSNSGGLRRASANL